MSTDGDGTSLPKSMRHRQILDVAEEHPDSPIDELASMVPSASPDLVERVLEEHGDPAADGAASSQESEAATDADSTNSDQHANADNSRKDSDAANPASTGGTHTGDGESSQPDDLPSLESLSEKQRAVLEVVARNPDATQQEVGDELGVSSATVSNRVNDIEGFDWSDRASFVAVWSDDLPTESAGESDASETGGPSGSNSSQPEPATENVGASDPSGATADEQARGQQQDASADLEAKFAALNARVQALEEARGWTERTAAFEDPELVHKVVHACMESDAITESEELRILETILTGSTG